MRTGSVVVVRRFLQHTHEMSLIQDDQLIKAFLANRAHPAFGNRIGFRRAKGCANKFKAFRDKNLVEAAREFTVTVVNEEVHRGLAFVAQVPNELTGLLRNPGTIRMGGAASQVDTTGAEFDEEEHIQCFQANGFDSGEITRQQLLPIVFQKGAP